VRRQLLIWRSLGETAKRHYEEEMAAARAQRPPGRRTP
jgi:hypothetical protein